jgi:plasmid maintenance system antidote protein VapI
MADHSNIKSNCGFQGEGFWMSLQADYDLEETRKRISEDLRHVEKLAA